MLLIFLIYFAKRSKTHKISSHELNTSISDGLTEAASLHPIIDPLLCIGCGSCVSACPEKQVLGLVHRKATLVNPANCIGHGACKTACPEQAIKLVFGSATRGVEIPDVDPQYQTCVSGIYIAGELGGMGLIRNAIEQGRQAIEFIAKDIKSTPDSDALDCLIVGAGPAGLTASLGAKDLGLSYLTIDQDTIGGTISHFPKGKLVMTQAATVPLVGKVKFGEIKKEPLMKFWLDTIAEHQLNINEQETLTAITIEGGLKRVKTTNAEYLAKRVLLAIGRRGSPRKLNIQGEELPKVVYRLSDPDEYRNKQVVVVGGGDSAIEAACSIAELNATDGSPPKVSLSYRKDSFSRAKAKNRLRLESLQEQGKLAILFNSSPTKITVKAVTIEQQHESIEMPNDAMIICAGGILPTGLLKEIGVKVEVKYGEE